MNLKLVATNDVHYITQADAAPHDVLLCIQTGSTIDDPNRLRFESQQFYLKSPKEMAKLFSHVPNAIKNTLEIAERCNCNFDFSQLNLPDPGIPEGVDPGEFMEAEARAGLLAKFDGKVPEHYEERFRYECDVIRQCGFAKYMMIVRDFTNFARKQGIYVGIRGSAAGSLVCYALGITDVDPIEYGLTFERFLNPERAEMPDVDLDIQDDRREELIQYVIDKYGKDRVGQIATFGSLKARAAVRDCGRVLGMDPNEVDRIAKMIPTVPVGMTIDMALEENPELAEEYRSKPEVARLLDTARSLEGVSRNVGIHAAGILISDEPLTNHVPVHYGSKGEVVAQLAKKDIAKVGLLKMDFLGLANLTILANAVKNVKRHRGIDIDILNIPLDDQKTFEMLGRGDTNGVFQLEGAGMRRNVMDLKPNSVRELAAIVALYRPGPMGEIPKFVKAKFSQQPIEYLHPLLEPILKETYGVICYQEQVLNIARAIAGFTLGQADVLRKAMSSKNRAILDKQREKFIEGAKNNGIDEEIAAKIYDQIEPFAGYAFNKAHAVCYAFVAYRTAYMKANYPVEYYAALLSANMDDKDSLAVYIDDCKRFGIEVLPPDINASGVEFEVENGAIRFGLGAVKNVGRGVIDAIIQEREKGGQFTSLHEFCRRVCDSTVTRSAIECLIKVGAFDSINKNRAMLLFILEDALMMAAKAQRDKRIGQVSLFGSGVAEEEASLMEPISLPQVKEATKNDILSWEKELLGLYLSDHPLLQYQEKLKKFGVVTSEQLKEKAEREEVVVGGVITRVRKVRTKKNEPMAFVTVEDFAGSIDVTLFPSTYEEYKRWLVNDGIVVVKGKANRRERIRDDDEISSEQVGVICESITPLSNGINGNGNCGQLKSVVIQIGDLDRQSLRMLQELLQRSPGENPVFFHIRVNGGVKKYFLRNKIEPSPKLIAEIQQIVGEDAVWLE
ncbi:MAG: DNA polymerase III subunit alpha, partial [Armatimonadota bacterium]|nr:DNA polymerase III subunit alpha [Armatimonadota bacterium]